MSTISQYYRLNVNIFDKAQKTNIFINFFIYFLINF